MSELSVNDHLEGILSDFEALKRSFEIEDVDDIPSFSASPVSTPISPSSSHFFLNHNKANEEHGGAGQSPSLAFNNNNSLGSADHHSCISLSSNPSPIFKSRTVVSSLSFNRGSMNKPTIHNNSSSMARAASFQSRLNPNSYSMLSGPGSDNDSLHSSTSSLEYSGGVGGALPLIKLGSYPSPPPQGEYHRTQPQLPQQHLEEGANLGSNQNLKKFSSHGSVFHSEMDQGPGMVLGVPQPWGSNHGSMPSLDLQIRDGGGGIVGMQRGGGGGRMSPGLMYANANANWNGHLHNATSIGEEGYCGSKKNCQPQGPQVLKAPQPKVKEIPRLNKFPLDLDSLVSSTSTTSLAKAQGGPMSPNPPKPPPRSTGRLRTNPPSTSASPSASLSSLDSSSETPPLSLHHPFLPLSPRSPTHLQGSLTVPEMSSSPAPIFPALSPQPEIPSGPQIVQMVPNLPSHYSSSSPSIPGAIQSLEDGAGDTRDSVGSILQRIASFSQSVVTHPTQAAVTQPPIVQSNGWLSSAFGCPAETMPMPSRKQGEKKQEETAGQLEMDPVTIMEERKEKEKGIMGQKEEDEGKSEGQPASMKTQNSMKEKEENCVEVCTEMEEKGNEEGEMKKEMELEAEVELCQSVSGQQISFIRGTDLFGYVGIEAVLDQMRRKTMKAGFEFNIMVVGQSGLGKSTLVNTLFKSKVSRKSCTPNYEEEISKTVKLHSVSHVIEEKGVNMKLTVIDTPGFGDQINNENCWEPIVKYVNEQYEKYLREELHVNRKRRIPDSRVHCCIYFLPATGHRLRPIDVEFLKRLGKIVSIIPVIAKADALTIEERQEFKERIRQDLAANGIHVYPQKEYDEDQEEHILNNRIRESIPFAVVGTDKEHQVNGNKVLGRKTKWGIIEVENVAHCEFANLRDLLIRIQPQSRCAQCPVSLAGPERRDTQHPL
ncbi:septin-9 isoform X2 [Xiphias gladius]|uniref:septin-9 isoform X2 n=1 Tax=Xiphias gladius TaxID=8245 RepID=UPI001A98CA59|nr:septin-9 isoform X2 [Xiphias gladius]